MFRRRSAHGREPGMNKKTTVTILIVGKHPLKESKMPAKLHRSNARITGHSGGTAMKKPITACTPPRQPFLAPGIMIPLDKNTVMAIAQLHQVFDHLPGLRPAVYIVAQKNQPVI